MQICTSPRQITIPAPHHLVQRKWKSVCAFATCMPKATWIVISCYPEFYGGRPVGYGKMWSFVLLLHASNGSHVALSQHELSLLFAFHLIHFHHCVKVGISVSLLNFAVNTADCPTIQSYCFFLLIFCCCSVLCYTVLKSFICSAVSTIS